MQEHYFTYGAQEMETLAKKDKKLAEAIVRIGMIRRPVLPDLFTALVNSIVAQQISSKALETVWGRLSNLFVTADDLAALSPAQIQACGMSMRKATYISDAAQQVSSGALNLHTLKEAPDSQVIETLCTLRGVGKWTAEMLMIFSMQRKDILSWDDLAILRGLRMLYGHRIITKERFARYKKRYSPYASVASLYLWEIAGGQWGYVDRAQPREGEKKRK